MSDILAARSACAIAMPIVIEDDDDAVPLAVPVAPQEANEESYDDMPREMLIALLRARDYDLER